MTGAAGSQSGALPSAPPEPVVVALALRAATLDERLSPAFAPVAGGNEDTEWAGRRLSAWCRWAAAGDWSLFARRLARDGWTLESVLPRLGAIQPLPREAKAAGSGWQADAAWILAALCVSEESPEKDGVGGPGEALPFEALFRPLLTEAARRRAEETLHPEALALVAPAALADLERQLLVSLTELCGGALYERFAALRNERKAPPDPASRELHDAFLASLRRGELLALFEAKPVLLRLLAVLTRQWIEASGELLSRLQADRPEIERTLFAGRPLGLLEAVESGLSDPHRGGRSVLHLRFGGGEGLIYKPKDLRADAAWAALLHWLNERQPPIDLRPAEVLPRDGYGWAARIAHGDCPDAAAAERFFQRAGGLLCLFHLLVGTDMHEENMIAAGEYPVPIDLEMLLQALDPGRQSGAPGVQAVEAADDRLLASVMTTGLLPDYQQRPDTGFGSAGGLGQAPPKEAQALIWRDAGSDGVTPLRGRRMVSAPENLPNLAGAPVQLADHVEALRSGCRDYFSFLLALKQDLLAADGPLAAFEGVAIRRVLRPTSFYWLLLQRLRDHRKMDDGTLWSSEADFVARLSDWDREQEALWPLNAAERRALERLDIPFFVHPADADLIGDGLAGAPASAGLVPGLQVARERIAALDETEIAWQCEVLRLATLGQLIPKKTAAPVGTAAAVPAAPPVVPPAVPPTAEEAVARAGRLAERLAARALRRGESAAWIGIDPLPDGSGWRLLTLGGDLYGGASGIALFLAAYARLSGDAAARDLALAALAPLRHRIASRRLDHHVRVTSLGAGSGLGSMIYALTACGGLLQEDALVADALRLAGRISDGRIASDRTYDIIGGAAGAILGLLRLYRDSGEAAVLERAMACGNHLLDSRPQGEQGPGLWRHLGDRPLTGFSHGAAGFAYALGALAAASGRESYAAAARDCLAYEASLFSPQRGNWPDLREVGPEEEPHWPCQWCHGAGGIGLARIGMLRFGTAAAPDGAVLADIATAVEAVRSRPPSGLDTLCCGNLGNIELLAEAAHALERSGLAVEASCATAAIWETAQERGAFGWNLGGDDDNLGLFRGLAGVGYGLLRRVAPEVVPNVLIWE